VPLAAVHELDASLTDEESREGWTPIWDIVGKLRYLADRTRHELQYFTSKLSTVSANAPPRFKKAAVDVMTYLLP
jgi:hypothetical protein